MRKLLIPVFWLSVGLSLLSCGANSPTGTRTSAIAFRAFVTNTVNASSSLAAVYVVDAANDVHPPTASPIGAGASPRMMVVTPNLAQTLVFSGDNSPTSDNQFSLISNASETVGAHIVLPGYTESFIASPDSSTSYVAVPTAPVVNQSPGAIEVVSLTTGTLSGEIDIPSVHYLSINNGGTRVLAFSDNSDSVAVVTPANLGTINPVVTYVGGFNRPVQAFFTSDDSMAYVVNCGAECGGASQASIQTLAMSTNTPGAPVGVCTTGSSPQCAASEALVVGSTMYVAGTPYTTGPNGGPSFTCLGAAGETLTCGMLSIVDLNSPSPTVMTSGIPITDGYHSRIAMGADGQLFIGASTCTEIVPPQPPPAGAEVRGCLSIYNTLSTPNGAVPAGGVVIPPVNGNATGIQPISNRSVVYVVQGYPTPGGSLFIYCTAVDTNTNCPNADAVQAPPAHEATYAPLMTGSFFDVKTVDF